MLTLVNSGEWFPVSTVGLENLYMGDWIACFGGTLWGSWRTRVRLGSIEQKEIQKGTLVTQAYLENSHPDK